jgi:hypothetical protein
MSYEELVRSNWGFISAEAQGKIRAARVMLAGCGLGSNIALLAARTGFTNFILADGDRVESGNLNRQAFRKEHLARNKAEVTAELVREINPQSKIEVFSQFITTDEEVKSMVSRSDLIINMVDPGPVLFQLNNAAIPHNKPVLFPINIGFGGMALIFTSGSLPLEQMASPDTKPEEFFFNLVLKMRSFLPAYLQQHIAAHKQAMECGLSFPQLGVASNISSALIVTAMIKLTLGLPLEVAPIPLTLDCWQPFGSQSTQGEPDALRG